MARRLVSASQVADWSGRIRAGVERAQARQHATVAAALKANGQTWQTPASQVIGEPWSQAAWSAAVAADLEPVARRVAAEVVAVLRSAHPQMKGDPTAQLVAMVTDRALSAGNALSRRLTAMPRPAGLVAAAVDLQSVLDALDAAPDRFGGVVHPESQSTVADAYQSMFGQLNDLTESTASHMSDAAVALMVSPVEASPVMLTWSAVGDEQTRDAHLEADGQQIAAGDSFDVGGESLMYPGDPSGSDENVCNCRCWIETSGSEAVGEEAGAA